LILLILLPIATIDLNMPMDIPIGMMLIYIINFPGMFITQFIPHLFGVRMLIVYAVTNVMLMFIFSITTYFLIGLILDFIIMKLKKNPLFNLAQ